MLAIVLGAAVLAGVFFWPEDPQTLMERGLAQQNVDPAQAEELLARSILAADGDFPEAQLALSRLLADQGRWEEASTVFGRIENPSRCEAAKLIRLADSAEQAGRLPLAEAALSAAQDGAATADAAVLRRLIEVRLQRGRLDLAFENSVALSRIDPRDPFPWIVQGRIHRAAKRVYPAIEAYRRALELTPENRRQGLRSELVGVLLESRNIGQAREEFDKLSTGAPLPATLRLQQAHLLRLESRPEEALRIVDELLKDEGDSTPALMLRGEIKFDLEDYRGAADDLEEVVRRLPSSKEAHYKLGMAHRALDNRQKAETHLQKSRTLGELSTTALALEQQAALEPENHAIRARLAELYDQLGDAQRANFWRSRVD